MHVQFNSHEVETCKHFEKQSRDKTSFVSRDQNFGLGFDPEIKGFGLDVDLCIKNLVSVQLKIIASRRPWHGMCSAGDHMKLESLVNRCRLLGYCGCDKPTLSELYSEADDRMFNGVVINPEHVLHQFQCSGIANQLCIL